MHFARVECFVSSTTTSSNTRPALHYLQCIVLHGIDCIPLHCIRTCLESFVMYPEISQGPLDLITRFHAHVLMNAFTLAFAYDMFGIFCEICRNQSMAPRFYYSDSCTWERQEDTQTSRHKERQQERPTDKQKHLYMSHPFSLFPFHAKPGTTRPWGPETEHSVATERCQGAIALFKRW